MLKQCTLVVSLVLLFWISASAVRRSTARSSRRSSLATMARTEYGSAAERRVVESVSSVMASSSSWSVSSLQC
jgi:hypothetical protein